MSDWADEKARAFFDKMDWNALQDDVDSLAALLRDVQDAPRFKALSERLQNRITYNPQCSGCRDLVKERRALREILEGER